MSHTRVSLKRLWHFLRHIRGIKLAKTRRRYERWIDRWQWFLDRQNLDWADVDHYDCAEFVDILRERRPWSTVRLHNKPYSASIISSAVSSLRTIYDFLVLEGELGANPWTLIRVEGKPQRLPVTLTEEEARRFLEAAGHVSQHSTEAGVTKAVRNSAICWVLYTTGIRVGELCALDIADVDIERQELMIRHGKGDKQRIVLTTSHTLREVEDWIQIYRQRYANSDGQALFLCRGGQRINRNRVAEVVDRASTRARIKKHVTPHTLRHTFATHLVENGAPLEAVQELMGHASLRSTEIYLHVSRAHVKKHYLLAHPLASP